MVEVVFIKEREKERGGGMESEGDLDDLGFGDTNIQFIGSS